MHGSVYFNKKYSDLLTILVVKKVSNFFLFLALSHPLEIYVLSVL